MKMGGYFLCRACRGRFPLHLLPNPYPLIPNLYHRIDHRETP
jgi:hypothetical protein